MGPLLRLPRAVHVLAAGSFVVSAGTMVIPFLTLYLATHLHLGTTFATLALGAYGVGQLLGGMLGGAWADRYGRRSPMIGGLLAAAILVTVLGRLSDPPAILLTVLFFSSGVACYRPAASAMISDLLSPADRPTGYSLLYASGNLGFAVAAGVGGTLAQQSYDWLFLADALASLSFVTIILLFVKETLVPRTPDSPAPPTGAWRHVLRNRPFLRFGTATFLASLVFHQAISTVPLQMEARGLDVAAYGQIMSLNGVMIMALQLPIAAQLARFNRALVVALGDVFVALGFGLNAFASTAPVFAISVAIWTIGEIIHAAFKFSMVGDFAPPELRARYFGAFQGVHAAAISIAPPLGGLVLAEAGSSWLWGGCVVLAALAFVLDRSLRDRLHPAPQVTSLPVSA